MSRWATDPIWGQRTGFWERIRFSFKRLYTDYFYVEVYDEEIRIQAIAADRTDCTRKVLGSVSREFESISQKFNDALDELSRKKMLRSRAIVFRIRGREKGYYDEEEYRLVAKLAASAGAREVRVSS